MRRRLTPRLEGGAGRFHGGINVRFAALRDFGQLCAVGRVEGLGVFFIFGRKPTVVDE
jgi:hypothetical protein